MAQVRLQLGGGGRAPEVPGCFRVTERPPLSARFGYALELGSAQAHCENEIPGTKDTTESPGGSQKAAQLVASRFIPRADSALVGAG